MTVLEWIEVCAAELEQANLWFGHGTGNAQDEAAWLISAVLERDYADQSFRFPDHLTDVQAVAVRKLLDDRIKTRKPLAYLLGEAWFCGLRFQVTEDVLVPRSPLAELIEASFQPWVDGTKLSSVLDLCTGGGCIGIAIAHYFPQLHVDISDISQAALAVAEQNIRNHGVQTRVQAIQSDLFSDLQGRQYDLIVSNPPYVSVSSYAELATEYLAEPEIGLVSAGQGLEIPLNILMQSASHLTEQGVLICEVGESAGQLERLLPEVPFIWLEFEHGGEGVFTIDRAALIKYRPQFEQLLEQVLNVA